MIEINKDSFASGQIGSKIWLCEELERTGWSSELTWIYGGWYATTALLLRTRGRFQVKMIESFDIDPACETPARLLNENWVWRKQFWAHTQDCNTITDVSADLVINTATEHFDSDQWWQNLPPGQRVVLQTNDMPHDDHVIQVRSIRQFMHLYPMQRIDYYGALYFDYPENSFTRYMLIGVK